MKKIFAGIISILLFIMSSAAFAADMNGEEVKISVTVNGENISFPDQQPVMINDRTLIPVRGVLEAMGKTVDWEEETQTVIIYDDTITVKLRVGEFTMQQIVTDSVNNETISVDIPLDAAPVVINYRTCLPIRAVAEAFMATVDWEEETQTVMIVSADLLC